MVTEPELSKFVPPGIRQEYRIRDFLFRIAEGKDNEALKSILRDNSMESWVKLSLEREPDYFRADTLYGEPLTIIAERHHEKTDVVGMYNSNIMPVFVNGRAERVPYLGGLRVNKHYRNRYRLFKYGSQSAVNLLPRGTLPYSFTSIATDNHVARKLFEANLDGMPHYQLLGNMVTLALPVSKGRGQGLMQPATVADIKSLVMFYNRQARGFQFAPVLDEEWLRGLDGSNGMTLGDFWLYKEEGKVKACLAVWDQRAFKQTLVRGYRFPLNHLRSIYNLAAGILGHIQLPQVGVALQQVYLSFFAFDNSSSVDVVSLIREGLSHASDKQAKVAVIGLAEKNPLLKEIEGSFPCMPYRTCIELVFLDGVEASDLSALSPQPEVAIL